MTHVAQGKPLFSFMEVYRILYQAFRTVPHMVRGEKQGLLSPVLRERLMMAVTEVNGCAMCSYYHTRMALETGMHEAEIKRLLAGELQDVPESELKALLFAQHYADMRGKPEHSAWSALVHEYGKAKSLAIVGAIRGIMMGNAYGIPAGSMLRRLGVKRFHIDTRSSVVYEVSILLSSIVLLPLAALHAGIAGILHTPVEPR